MTHMMRTLAPVYVIVEFGTPNDELKICIFRKLQMVIFNSSLWVSKLNYHVREDQRKHNVTHMMLTLTTGDGEFEFGSSK